MATRAILVHSMCSDYSDLFAFDEHLLDLLETLAADRIDTLNKDGSSCLLHFDLALSWIDQISQFLVVDL